LYKYKKGKKLQLFIQRAGRQRVAGLHSAELLLGSENDVFCILGDRNESCRLEIFLTRPCLLIGNTDALSRLPSSRITHVTQNGDRDREISLKCDVRFRSVQLADLRHSIEETGAQMNLHAQHLRLSQC